MKLFTRTPADHSPCLKEASRLQPGSSVHPPPSLRHTKGAQQPPADTMASRLKIGQSAENSTMIRSFQSSQYSHKQLLEPSEQENISFQALDCLSNMHTATLPHLLHTEQTDEVCDGDSPSTLNNLVKVKLSKLKQPRNNITAATCSTTGESLEKTDQLDPNNEVYEESIRKSGSMVITFGPTTKYSKTEINSKQEERLFRGPVDGQKEQSKSPEGRDSLGTLASSIQPKFLLTNSSKNLTALSAGLSVPQTDNKLLKENRRLDIVDYLPELAVPAEGSRSPRKANAAQ